MLGIKVSAKRKGGDEAEKPFWISFSDLMTALMVLFLVAMAVALMAVTQRLQSIETVKDHEENAIRDRARAIRSCMDDVTHVTTNFPGVAIKDYSIEFGTLAEFAKERHDLTVERREFLRSFVPQVLAVARHPSCDKWLKRVVVEGFASQEGFYLYNLNLSLQRSQRVLCVLLDSRSKNALSTEDRWLARRLFLVGGSSFNAVKKSPEESRRVELKLEFYELNRTDADPPEIPWDEDPTCPLDK